MNKLNLIFLDDDKDLVDSIIENFDSDFFVYGFTNFKDCINFLKSEIDIDIVLCDYNFKDNRNGLIFIKELKEHLSDDVLYILFTGSHSINDDIISSLNIKTILKPHLSMQFLVQEILALYVNHIKNTPYIAQGF